MRAAQFIGSLIRIEIERPLGSFHPTHGYPYPINYGFVAATIGGDGEPIDAYVLGIIEPLESFHGRCVAVIHRLNDDDDKLVVVPDGLDFTDQTIAEMTFFQERFFDSVICRTTGGIARRRF